MESNVQVFENKVSLLTILRVAAYARVSAGQDTMLRSFEAQKSYYSQYIASNSNWVFAGLYADKAETGTKETRPEFQRMLDDCRAGRIDLIITKSISRFARNTVTVLRVARELKQLNIGIFFEEHNINTLSAEGELMLTLLASCAQDESYAASENQKWRARHGFEQGIPWTSNELGYRKSGDHLEVEPHEAETVRFIFDSYLGGLGFTAIARRLNEMGLLTRKGNIWQYDSVRVILKNYTYTGNLILQKTYRNNHIEKKRVNNQGEVRMYHVQGSHEPIISIEQYEAVQREMQRRAVIHYRGKAPCEYTYTHKIICGVCGKHFVRKSNKARIVWTCPTYNHAGIAGCASKQIHEQVLDELTESIGGIDAVESIEVFPDMTIVFNMKDGTVIRKTWYFPERRYKHA